MAFLRDGAIARVEAGLALLADIDVPRVRQLLYGMDKRGLAALCARAGFGAPHYIAMRMALDLAEQGMEGADPEPTYCRRDDRLRPAAVRSDQKRPGPDLALVRHLIAQARPAHRGAGGGARQASVRGATPGDEPGFQLATSG